MQISRRDALMGAGAAAVVAGVPVAVMGDPVEPLLAMEREWFAQRDYIHNYPDDSDAALDPLYDRRDAIEEKIMGTPARSFAGIAVKLRLAAYYFEVFNSGYSSLDWDRKIVFHALRDLERLAGEG